MTYRSEELEMSYPNLLAELERLRQLKANTKEWGKKKRIRSKLRKLNEEKERYEIAYFGKVLG